VMDAFHFLSGTTVPPQTFFPHLAIHLVIAHEMSHGVRPGFRQKPERFEQVFLECIVWPNILR